MDAERSPLLGDVVDLAVASGGLDPIDITARIRREVESYRLESLVSEHELFDSVSANLQFVIDSSRLRGDPHTDVAFHIGELRERVGLPLETVLAAYRVGSQAIWEGVAECAEAGQLSTRALARLATDVWLLHDRFARSLEEGWRSSHVAAEVRASRERGSLVDAVLRGDYAAPSALWVAVDRLGLPRDGEYVVVVVAVETTGLDPLPGVERRLERLGVASAWLLRAESLIGVVSLKRPGAEASLLDDLRAAAVTAGISPVRSAYPEAADALRLAAAAAAASAPGSLTRFADAPLAVTLASIPDIAREAAQTVLAGLGSLAADDRDVLLTTLRAWIAAGGSVAETARAMFLHPNSVRNRLHRLESLTGKSLRAPRDLVQLAFAADAVRAPARVPPAASAEY